MASLDEQRAAYRVGLMRERAARARGAIHSHGWIDWGPDEAGRRDFDGQSAVSEMLVAEYVGRRWLSTGVVPDSPEDGDVEGGLSVRWTAHRHGHLLVWETDSDNLISVLVVGRAPKMDIVGWINTYEAKIPRYWREPPKVKRAAYFVPQAALNEPYLLRKALPK